MKKVIRLTESDLVRLVKKVIKETETNEGWFGDLFGGKNKKPVEKKPLLDTYREVSDNYPYEDMDTIKKELDRIMKMSTEKTPKEKRYRYDDDDFFTFGDDDNDVEQGEDKNKTFGGFGGGSFGGGGAGSEW